MDIHSTLSGRYNLVITKPDGTTSETGWFDNLILDQGLDQIGVTGVVCPWCQVGTGNTAVLPTQTALTTLLASRGNAPDQYGFPSEAYSLGPPTYGSVHRFTYAFPQGTVVGNLAEIGVGWAATGTTLFSRALITDGGGSPTTITVTAIDQLTVYYQLTMVPTTSVVSGSVVLAGNTYNYVSSIANAASYYVGDRYLFLTSNFWGPYGLSTCIYTGNATITTLPPITGQISPVNGWTSTGAGPLVAITTLAYTLGTYYRDGRFTFAVGGANEAGGIGAIAPSLGNATTPFAQYVFTPAIPKNNTKTLSLTFRTSWARGA
jgi:hypothetical protein